MLIKGHIRFKTPSARQGVPCTLSWSHVAHCTETLLQQNPYSEPVSINRNLAAAMLPRLEAQRSACKQSLGPTRRSSGGIQHLESVWTMCGVSHPAVPASCNASYGLIVRGGKTCPCATPCRTNTLGWSCHQHLVAAA